jgi:Domain of unknown function (DUF4145)
MVKIADVKIDALTEGKCILMYKLSPKPSNEFGAAINGVWNKVLQQNNGKLRLVTKPQLETGHNGFDYEIICLSKEAELVDGLFEETVQRTNGELDGLNSLEGRLKKKYKS